jgi:hypothetical protein
MRMFHQLVINVVIGVQRFARNARTRRMSLRDRASSLMIQHAASTGDATATAIKITVSDVGNAITPTMATAEPPARENHLSVDAHRRPVTELSPQR